MASIFVLADTPGDWCGYFHTAEEAEARRISFEKKTFRLEGLDDPYLPRDWLIMEADFDIRGGLLIRFRPDDFRLLMRRRAQKIRQASARYRQAVGLA